MRVLREKRPDGRMGEIVVGFEAGEVIPRPLEGVMLFLFATAKGCRLWGEGERDLLALAIGRAILATAERGEVVEGGAEPLDFSPLERRLKALRADAEEPGIGEARLFRRERANGFEEALRLLTNGEEPAAGVGLTPPVAALREVEDALSRKEWLSAADLLGAFGFRGLRRLVRAAECLAAGSPQDAIDEVALLDGGRCPECRMKIRRDWNGEGDCPGHKPRCPRQGQPPHTWETA